MDRKSLVVVLGIVTFVLAMALARLARGDARATARHIMIEIFSGLVAAAIAVWFTDSPPGLSPTQLMLSLRNAVLPTTTETPAPTAAPAPDLPFPRQPIPPLGSRSPGPAHPAPPPNQTPLVSSPSRTPAIPAIIPVTASAFTPLSTTSTDPATPIAGLAVTVDNGNTARRAVVTLSANTGVDPDAEVRLGYSVDGASPRENVYGPSDLASHQQYSEVRVVTAVIPLAAGTHTITPYWRVSAAPGAHATMDARCLTVESEASDIAATEPIVPVTASAFTPLSTTSTEAAQPIPGLAVTVDNGNTARRAVVTLSADTAVDADAESRVAYSVDGGSAQENAYGPANLANHRQYPEARMVTAVIPLAAGTHTITPYWRVSAAPGAHATMGARCLTVKSEASDIAATEPIVPVTASAFSPLTTTSANPAQPIPGLTVTVSNGNTARRALVTLSANTGVDPNAEVRLTYSIDGAPPQENAYGPASLASHHQYYEGKAMTAVIPLPPGTHTITAYWRVIGPPGAAAHMDARCLTVESTTTR